MTRTTLARIESPTDNEAHRRWDAALGAGYEGIELVVPQGPPGECLAKLAQLAAGYAERCPARAIAVCVDSSDPDLAIVHVEGWLRRAHDWGALCLNVTLPALGDQRSGFRDYTEAINFVHTLLRQVRPTAESTGVVIGLEPRSRFPASPIELRELIDEANTWAIGACVDATGPVHHLGSASEWLRTLHRRMMAVRIRPSNADTPDDITAVLDEIRFEGPVIVCEMT